MFGFNKEELGVLKKLDSPKKIQDFLEKLEINFEENGETLMSPRRVLREGKAHCVEGALLAAAALRLQGHKPLLLDLSAVDYDEDHVVAVFRQHGKWGAISKTNHPVLRYREPVYSGIKELVMSFFHEYFDNDGKKTLRSYSMPVDLRIFDKKGWMIAEEDLWYINDHLFKVPHKNILTRSQISALRKADRIEIDATGIVQFRDKRKSS